VLQWTDDRLEELGGKLSGTTVGGGQVRQQAVCRHAVKNTAPGAYSPWLKCQPQRCCILVESPTSVLLQFRAHKYCGAAQWIINKHLRSPVPPCWTILHITHIKPQHNVIKSNLLVGKKLLKTRAGLFHQSGTAISA